MLDLASGELRRYDHTGLDLASERERGWLQRPERAMFLGGELAVFARPVSAGAGTGRASVPGHQAYRSREVRLVCPRPRRRAEPTADIAGVAGSAACRRQSHHRLEPGRRVSDLRRRSPRDARPFRYSEPAPCCCRHVRDPGFCYPAGLSRKLCLRIIPARRADWFWWIWRRQRPRLVCHGGAGAAFPIAGSRRGRAFAYRHEDGPVTRCGWRGEERRRPDASSERSTTIFGVSGSETGNRYLTNCVARTARPSRWGMCPAAAGY